MNLGKGRGKKIGRREKGREEKEGRKRRGIVKILHDDERERKLVKGMEQSCLNVERRENPEIFLLKVPFLFLSPFPETFQDHERKLMEDTMEENGKRSCFFMERIVMMDKPEMKAAPSDGVIEKIDSRNEMNERWTEVKKITVWKDIFS